jgi:hypothetical protein
MDPVSVNKSFAMQPLKGCDLRSPGSHPRRTPVTTRPPLRQGTDPAAEIYREQVRREVEAAHRWLAKQVKR